MATLNISSALRHVAAAFGSKDARRLLDQQKRDRLVLKDLKNTFCNKRPDAHASPTTTRSSAATAHLPLRDIKTVPIPLSRQPGGWLHNHWLANQPKTNTTDIAAPTAPSDTTDAPNQTQRKKRPAPDTPPPPVPKNGRELHPNAMKRQESINGPFDHESHLNHQATALINAEEDITSMFGELDPADMQSAPAIALPQGEFTLPRALLGPHIPAVDYDSDVDSVPIDYDTDSGSGIVSDASLSDSDSEEQWEALTPEDLAAANERFRQEDQQIAQFEARAANPPLAAKSKAVLEHAKVLRESRVAQEAKPSVAAHARPAPGLIGTQPIVVAQLLKAPAPPAPASAPAPPPPPQPQPARPAAQAQRHAAADGLFTELRRRTFETSQSLDEKATVSFGTRKEGTDEAPGNSAHHAAGQPGTWSHAGGRRMLPPELIKALAERRAVVDPEPESRAPERATAPPTVTHVQPKTAVSVVTPAKLKGAAGSGPQISDDVRKDFLSDLQATLALRQARSI